MVHDVRQRSARGALAGGLGAVAFGGLTLAALFTTNAPGGTYTAAQVSSYLSHGHRISELAAFLLGMLGILDLVVLLVQLRDVLAGAGNERTAAVVWGTGLVAAACFAIGWGVAAGQVLAHWEGGSSVALSPAATYVISEVGVVFAFGCGAMLLGFALIALTLSSGGLLPGWVRGVLLVLGLCGVAGLAWA